MQRRAVLPQKRADARRIRLPLCTAAQERASRGVPFLRKQRPRRSKCGLRLPKQQFRAVGCGKALPNLLFR